MKQNTIFKRDLYLRKMLLGEILGPPTGNIFLDKNWLINHEIRPISDFNLNDTLYNTYVNFAQEHLDDLAIIEMNGTKYTHRQLIELIENCSVGLLDLNIRRNSRVGLMLNGTIEDVVTWLAINKLGGISKFIDYTKSEFAIEKSITSAQLDLLIMDEEYINIEPTINTQNIPVVVVDDLEHEGKYISYHEICKNIKHKKSYTSKYFEGKTSIIINSSGTTGPAKPIGHSDFSVNAAAQKMLCTDYSFGQNNILVKMVPSQIGLGLITTLYTGLLTNTPVLPIPWKDPEILISDLCEFFKNFSNFKKENNLDINTKILYFSAPAFIRPIILNKEITDLSCFTTILAAGSKIEKKELDFLHSEGKKKGLEIPICNGYGQNEMAGAISLNYINQNLNGSGGFPTIGTEVRIVDPKTMEFLNINEEGLIFEQSDSQFEKYDNMPEETENSTKYLKDGRKWFQTNDIGYMSEDGFLHVTGRITGVATRCDFKISINDVASKIKTLPNIDDCAALMTKFGGSWEEFVVFVETKDKNMNLMELINDSSILSELEMPTEIIFIEKLLYKNAGKLDELYLKEYYHNYKINQKQRKLIKEEDSN